MDTGHLRFRSRLMLLLVLVWVTGLAITSIVRIDKRFVADESLVTEAALDGMFHGFNPYARDYRGTLLDTWIGNATHESWINGHHPSATHYVYFPGHLIVSIPFYATALLFHVPYDQRVVYLAAFVVLFLASYWGLRNSPVRDPLLVAFAFNPFLAVPLAYGFNDMTTIAALGVAGLALAGKKYTLMAVSYGLALATKQWAMITVPFTVLIFFRQAPRPSVAWRSVLLAALTVVVILLPFVAWSPPDFYEDTIGIFIGQPWYPISGEGISHLLLELNIVRPESTFPFWIFQLVAAVPISIVAWAWLRRQTTLERVYLASAISIAAIWFFSRYFLHFHIVAVMMLIILAFIVGESERTTPA